MGEVLEANVSSARSLDAVFIMAKVEFSEMCSNPAGKPNRSYAARAIKWGMPRKAKSLPEKPVYLLRATLSDFEAREHGQPYLNDTELKLEYVQLPSTSPANAGVSYVEKLLAWEAGLS